MLQTKTTGYSGEDSRLADFLTTSVTSTHFQYCGENVSRHNSEQKTMNILKCMDTFESINEIIHLFTTANNILF